MSDYSGIGDGMLTLAVIAAFTVPALFGLLFGFVLLAAGLNIAAYIAVAIGVASGALCAISMARS